MPYFLPALNPLFYQIDESSQRIVFTEEGKHYYRPFFARQGFNVDEISEVADFMDKLAITQCAIIRRRWERRGKNY